MTMGALGARGALLEPGEAAGVTLALKGDAFWVRMESEAATSSGAANLEAAEAGVSRLRLVLDASRSFETGGSTVTPRLEAELRHDGGDAETGIGVAVRAGIGYTDAGVTVEGSVGGLAAHEASGYEEWGASAAVRIDPGAGGRGLSLSFNPTVGAASETDPLWSAADMRALAPGGAFEATRRLDAEVGYGFGAPLGVVTPYAGLGLADGAGRAWRAGARWNVAPDVTLGLEGTHSESAGTAPERGVMLHGAMRW